METWEEFDTYVKKDVASTNVKNGMLRAQLTVLLVKNVVRYQTDLEIVQQALRRYDVEYALEDIRVELTSMMHEEYLSNKHVLNKEDFFEGF